MFIDQFGIGNIMMPVQRYQPIDPGRPQQQRMLTPNRSTAQGYTQDLANPFGSGTSAVASGAPPSGLPAPATAQAPAVPPGWSTPPFNPNGTVQPAGAPAAPAAAPEPPAEPVTVDQGGTVIPEPPLTTGPGVFQLKEGPTTADRMRAGFMMLAASGQSNFAQVAGTVNAGLAQKQQEADKWNQALFTMTKPRYEEATDKDGRIIRKTYPAQYSYDPTTSTVREVPGAAAQAPKIDVLYDPTKPNDNREMYKDGRGLQRWKDTNDLVNPDESARLDRDAARGGLTPKDAQTQFKDQTAVLQDMKKNYNILQRTLHDTENPFSDVATLFSFMKTADPGSVVRPSEAEMFSGAGSYGTIAANFMNKIISGQSLTNMQQMQLAQVVDQLMLGQIEDVQSARANWEEYFGLPDQVADKWSTDILNPVDPLYGTSMAEDVIGRLNNGNYQINGTSLNTLTDDDQAALEKALEEQRAEEEAIRRGANAGVPPRNPRIPGVGR